MKLKKWVPIIGVLLFIYILFKINLKEVIFEIGHANLNYLLLAILGIFSLLIMQTLKWFVIARKQEIKIPFKKAFKINFITDFYGFVTPSRVGSVIRADYLKKYTNNEIGKGFCNFVLEKILDILSIVFMAILFSFILSIKFKDKVSFLPLELFILIFIVMIILTWIFLNKKRSRLILSFFYKKLLPLKMKGKTKDAFNQFYEKIPKKRYFPLFFIINIITWINTYLISFFIGKSLGINLSIFYFLAILPIGTLITMIPITINGLGTREATLIKLFSLFGISSTKVFSMSIIGLFFSGILPAMFALIFIFDKNKKV